MPPSPSTGPPIRGVARLIRKVRRESRWIRSDGVGRFVEEHRLHPVSRTATAYRKWRWRRGFGVPPGTAAPVFLVGSHRSGTNMVVRGFDVLPEFEIHNENERVAFSYNRLRPDPVLRDIVARSRHRYVLFKPLADSHRTAELLDTLGTPVPPRAVWIYRDVDGRAGSAVAKFGSSALDVLREIVAGRAEGRWQCAGLSIESRRLLAELDLAARTPFEGAALLWYVRNRLFFELGLHRRADVLLLSYDALTRDPEPTMRAVCAFLGAAYAPALVADIDHAARRTRPLELHPRVRACCDALTRELDAAAAAALSRYAAAAAAPE